MADWISAPIVTVPLPACPRCGAVEHRPIKGWRNDDGSRVSRRICTSCRLPYIVRRHLTPKLGGNNRKAGEPQ